MHFRPDVQKEASRGIQVGQVRCVMALDAFMDIGGSLQDEEVVDVSRTE